MMFNAYATAKIELPFVTQASECLSLIVFSPHWRQIELGFLHDNRSVTILRRVYQMRPWLRNFLLIFYFTWRNALKR